MKQGILLKKLHVSFQIAVQSRITCFGQGVNAIYGALLRFGVISTTGKNIERLIAKRKKENIEMSQDEIRTDAPHRMAGVNMTKVANESQSNT